MSGGRLSHKKRPSLPPPDAVPRTKRFRAQSAYDCYRFETINSRKALGDRALLFQDEFHKELHAGWEEVKADEARLARYKVEAARNTEERRQARLAAEEVALAHVRPLAPAAILDGPFIGCVTDALSTGEIVQLGRAHKRNTTWPLTETVMHSVLDRPRVNGCKTGMTFDDHVQAWNRKHCTFASVRRPVAVQAPRAPLWVPNPVGRHAVARRARLKRTFENFVPAAIRPRKMSEIALADLSIDVVADDASGSNSFPSMTTYLAAACGSAAAGPLPFRVMFTEGTRMG